MIDVTITDRRDAWYDRAALHLTRQMDIDSTLHHNGTIDLYFDLVNHSRRMPIKDFVARCWRRYR